MVMSPGNSDLINSECGYFDKKMATNTSSDIHDGCSMNINSKVIDFDYEN